MQAFMPVTRCAAGALDRDTGQAGLGKRGDEPRLTPNPASCRVRFRFAAGEPKAERKRHPKGLSLVAEDDGARCEPIEQGQRSRRIVRLPRAQAEPERETLPVNDRVDLGRETAPGATETMISTPLFAVAACWCARMEVLSIIWMSPS
jgi:hypothetical protein